MFGSFDAIEAAGLSVWAVRHEIVGRPLGSARARKPQRTAPGVLGDRRQIARGLQLLELSRTFAVVVGPVRVDRSPHHDDGRARRSLAGPMPLPRGDEQNE